QPLPATTIKRPVGNPGYGNGTIVLRDGTPATVPTCYHGALRIRLLHASQAIGVVVQPVQLGETLFVLDVTPEPRLQQFSIVGMPRVDKAIDNADQQLAMKMEATSDQKNAASEEERLMRLAIAIRANTAYPNNLPPQVHQSVLRLTLGVKKAT